MRSRNRSIRVKIATILAVPLGSLVVFWAYAVFTAFRDLRALERLAAAGAVARGGQAIFDAALQLVLVCGLGLLAIVASIVIAIRVGRPIVRELRGLSAGTRDFAYRRLPMITERLRRGEEIDGDFDAPTYSFTTTETVELLESFVTARRAAVQAAVQESAVRRGIGDVFLNLARRSQALLHRQLGLLDTLERQASEPDELDHLFRLDHLATRMRRHAEGLVILSGASPGRGWRNPVPLVDVVRGAVAEVEDYARVTVLPVPQVSLAGPSVADVIHMLAELVENATLFSPPHTDVRVGGQLVGNGFAVEIEDRGLGMSAEDLAAANELLETPREFDLSDSTRLGFFVVSRLAWRHGIRVSLRPSPYGGTAAIVLMPWSIVVQDPKEGRGAGQASDSEAGSRPNHIPLPAAAKVVSGAFPESAPSGPVAQNAPSEPVAQNAPSGDAQETRQSPPPAGPFEPVRRQERLADHEGRPVTGAHRAAPKHAAAPSPPPTDPNGIAVPSSDENTGEDAAQDLPRRVRQASIAPQLRDNGPERDGEPDAGGEPERAPEETRATMASMQQGWLRGRAEETPAAHPAGSAATSTEEEDVR